MPGMMQLFHVQVPIFNLAVVVATRCTEQEAIDAIYDYNGNRMIMQPCPARGWVQVAGGDVYMYVREPDNNASTVFHELLHVAFSICQRSSMACDEELIAYLMGWLKINVCDEIFNPDRLVAEDEQEGSE